MIYVICDIFHCIDIFCFTTNFSCVMIALVLGYKKGTFKKFVFVFCPFCFRLPGQYPKTMSQSFCCVTFRCT